MTNKSTKSSPLFSSVNYSIEIDSPIIVGFHLKTPENMGHIIRLASNFGCSKVIFVGDKERVRESKIKKVAGAAVGQVEWMFCSDDDWRNNVPDNYTIVAIETAENSLNICSNKLPKKMVILLGNEIHGLSTEIIKQCNATYHIPMVGSIKSMNVSNACCVALYEWVSQNLKID